MLGKRFCPRIRKLSKQRIYRIDEQRDYGALQPLVNRTDRTIKIDWVVDQWDRMGQFYATLRGAILRGLPPKVGIPQRQLHSRCDCATVTRLAEGDACRMKPDDWRFAGLTVPYYSATPSAQTSEFNEQK